MAHQPAAAPSFLIPSTSSLAHPVPSSSHHCHSPSNSPFRYIQLRPQHPAEKHPKALLSDPPAGVDDHPFSGPSCTPGGFTLLPKDELPYPPPRILAAGPPFPPSQCRGRLRGIRVPDRLKPWLGIGSWAATSIGFLLAIAFWKKEVFTGLDQLSTHLQALGSLGYAVLFCLIFITTIPPFPLYSTLIILSGYTFGVWIGAIISYTAALSGAVVVFLLSRRYLRDGMSRVLSYTTSLKRVVRAIEKRPKLLLLIRVAPYPYNLLNVLLASSHTLTFSTYFTCTALSLIKVVIHTSVGSSIHSFAGYHSVVPEGLDGGEEDGGGGGAARGGEEENGLGKVWTVTGIMLCFAILVYLSYVARRAVDDELEDEAVARAERGFPEFGAGEEMSEVLISH